MLKHQFLESDRISVANITKDWFYTDTLQRYNEVKDKNPSYHPGDFVYKFNNKGFRCDDFDLWEKHPIRILFSGCSETEGVGIPLEKTWAKVFHNMLCKKIGPIPFWSIAHGAASLDHQVKHLYNEGNILRPQIVISYLPRFERRERWNGDYWGPWTSTVSPESKIFLKEEYVRYQTEKNLSFINLLMNKWDCEFLYSQIDKDYDLSYINFPKFKSVPFNMDPVDIGRDGWHHGPVTNQNFAEKMFEHFWPIIKEKIGV